jgi:hypothetical protein
VNTKAVVQTVIGSFVVNTHCVSHCVVHSATNTANQDVTSASTSASVVRTQAQDLHKYSQF